MPMTSEPIPVPPRPADQEMPVAVIPGMPVEPETVDSSDISAARRRFGASWLGPFLRNRKAILGTAMLLTFVLAAVLAPQLAEFGPKEFAARPNQAPSRTHLVGTDGLPPDEQLWRGLRAFFRFVGAHRDGWAVLYRQARADVAFAAELASNCALNAGSALAAR